MSVPDGSKCAKNEYWAQDMLVISYIEIQNPHYMNIGTWTLRVYDMTVKIVNGTGKSSASGGKLVSH